MFGNNPEQQTSFADILAQIEDNPEVDVYFKQHAEGLREASTLQIKDFVPRADQYQKEFIYENHEIIRLIAPAGSGKTQTIINRVIEKARNGVDIGTFLLLAFDRSARDSLIQKFQETIPSHRPGSQKLQVEALTLNSFGNRVIMRHLDESSGNLEVASNSDQIQAVLKGLRALEQSDQKVKQLMPRKMALNVYLSFFSMLKNNLIDPLESSFTEYLELISKTGYAHNWVAPYRNDTDFEDKQKKILAGLFFLFSQYGRILTNARRIDFDDQKLLTYKAFREDTQVLNNVCGKYNEIIVDEFQDINLLDFELIRLISSNRRLVVVGDDDQAIYGFRGCSPDYILNLEKHLNRPIKTKVLEINYRCPANIVRYGDTLISHNENRLPKKMIAARDENADVQVFVFTDSVSEARTYAKSIAELKARMGDALNYRDIAILYRIHDLSLPLQIALIAEEIPYHCRKEDNLLLSPNTKTFVKLLNTHLNLKQNPALVRKEYSDVILDSFFAYIQKEHTNLFHQLAKTHNDYRIAAEELIKKTQFKSRAMANLFPEAVSELYEEHDTRSMVNTVLTFFEHIGGHITSMEKSHETKVAYAEFAELAHYFQGPPEDYVYLLQSLINKAQSGLSREHEGDAVNMMSYFKAKGRQWKHVFLPSANQEYIPGTSGDVEEERRLFYVAITRATHSLTISYLAPSARTTYEPSQFIREAGFQMPKAITPNPASPQILEETTKRSNIAG